MTLRKAPDERPIALRKQGIVNRSCDGRALSALRSGLHPNAEERIEMRRWDMGHGALASLP